MNMPDVSLWQDVAALALVAAATAYVLWHILRWRRRKAGGRCGACASCAPRPDRSPLVTLSPPEQRETGDRA
jgi:hypothetical protein